MLFITATLFFITTAACLFMFVSTGVSRSSSNDIVVGGMNGPVIFNRPEGQRFFYFYVPSTYTPKNPLPLIIYFHGYSGNWTQGVVWNQTLDAETNDYIIAFGAGTPSAEVHHYLGWNGGACCLFNTTIPVDDVMYAKLIVVLIGERVAIATDRVYAMGCSNGGFMVECLGCEAWDVFTGVAAVASEVILGSGYEDGLARCDMTFKGGQIDYIHFHGTHDTVVPWMVDMTLANDFRQRWQILVDGLLVMVVITCRCKRIMTVWYAPHFRWTVGNSGFSTADYIMKAFTRKFMQRQKRKIVAINEI